MNVLDPKSWTSFEFHPEIIKAGFENWRQFYLDAVGDDPSDDPDHVLAVVRYVCESIHNRIEGLTTKLVNLDDIDFCVEISGCGVDGELGYYDEDTVWIYLQKYSREGKEINLADEVPVKEIITELVPKEIVAEMILNEFELTPLRG